MPDERYLVAARKYRPTRFCELVAQEHVTGTLENAIRLDRLAHAYLFSGPRGIGKTTAARILAKAINCETPLDEREDGAEPCRECPSCRAFEAGRSLNIIELDAASNNKVDDIRELRETVRIPPQGSKRKVYIIDEVHMLSNQAFNALLKTLEDPPPHVLSIFATTEPHKVLPTILSRCQRFDFRRIPVPAIVERLREICAKEGITADEESLMLLARKGDGALRDALSAFDQAVSLCGTDLAYAELAQAMGVVDVDLFFRLTGHVQAGDSGGMLQLVEEVVRAGYDLQEFLAGLAEHLRNLLVARTMDDLALIEAAGATRQRYAETAEAFSEAGLLRLLLIAGEAESDVTQSSQPRLALEMALLKMASLPRSADLREALEKIDRLEAMARAGKLPAAPPTSGPSSGGASGSANGAMPGTSEKEIDRRKQETSSSPAPEKSPTAETPSEIPGDDAPDETEIASEAPSVAEAPGAYETAGAPDPPAGPSSGNAPSGSEQASSSGDEHYTDLFGTPALRRKKPHDSASPSGDASPQSDASSATATLAVPAKAPAAAPLADAWPEFVASIREERIRIGTLLQESRPRAVMGGTVTIGVPDAFHRSTLAEHRAFLMERLSTAVAAVTTETVEEIRFVIDDTLRTSDGGETAHEKDPYEVVRTLREDHPVVRALFDTFGGEIVYR